MNSEKYFFKYAWPCTEVILTDKRITQQRFDDLKYAVEHDITPSRGILEDTYKVAFVNLKELAERMNKDYWDIEVVKKYFSEEEHNMLIESKKAFFNKFPPSVRDLCKIHTAVIDKIETIAGKRIMFVSYYINKNNSEESERKERRCINLYNLELKQGDQVIIHYAYIIEKAN